MRSLSRAADKADVLLRLRALQPDSPRRWGRMTPHQAVCHLGDAFLIALGEKSVSPATGVLQRTLVKWVALYTPLPWPRGIRTRPEIDQCLLGLPQQAFPSDVERLEALVERVSAPARRLEGKPHPIFGNMTDEDWLRWGYLHMDHHLRQFGV